MRKKKKSNQRINYPKQCKNIENKGNFNNTKPTEEKPLSSIPQDLETSLNLAISHYELKEFEQAKNLLQKIILAEKNNSQAHYKLGIIYLLQGNFKQGWEEYEWVQKTDTKFSKLPPHLQWKGDELNGKNIVLISEQNLRETIFFIRYVPSLIARGANIFLDIQVELRRWFSDNQSLGVVLKEQTPVNINAWVGLSSLPRIFQTNLNNNIPNQPYLNPPLNGKIPQPLVNAQGLKVGIVWKTPLNPILQRREIPLQHFTPILSTSGCSFFSLQDQSCQEEINQARLTEHLVDLSAYIHDFADLATIIANLDLVITIDTSVAHLAGAMSKPVWVLLPFVPHWCWLLERQDSPWYPSASLFRQPKLGDWESVLSEVKQKLEESISPKDPKSQKEFKNLTPNNINLQPKNQDYIRDLFKKALNYAYHGDTQSTADCYHQILNFAPDYFPALVNLGNIVKDEGKYQEALDLYERALSVVKDNISSKNNADLAPIHNNLANLYKDRGQISPAIEHFRLAVEFDPSLIMAQSNLVFALNYSNDYQPEQIYQEHLNWYESVALPFTKEIKPHHNDLKPHRRLKIGYVSKDFGCHPVSYFFGSILARHNRSEFEMICYSNNPNTDDLTRLLQQLADGWRQIDTLNDQEVAELIRQDQIDILIDLSGHTAGNRILVFARKPAPIQVTYLAYPNTTGLSTMDYRLTDAWADPLGTTEHLHTEELIRLPHGFLCYQPPSNTPPVSELPLLQKGYVTFGCFNNLAKVNLELVGYWCQILDSLPTAKMIIKSKPLADERTRDYLRGLFEQHGINPSRLEFYGNINPYNEHLALYHHIDIALDTFPYHGTTTTCEALWMGIPVITLGGKSHVSRVGVSLLSSVGLQDLIADSPSDYIHKAISLAQNISQLQQLRSNLRGMMQSSTLTNGSLFTKSFENALRTMWQNYCSSQGVGKRAEL